MKKNINILTFMLLPLFFVSCQVEVTRNTYPEPSENPVKFTSVAQTREIRVKNLLGIVAEKPETDKVEQDNHQTATSNTWTKIENDWITFNHGGSRPFDYLTISVKENTTDTPRIYNLTLSSPLNNVTLTVIQAGAVDN